MMIKCWKLKASLLALGISASPSFAVDYVTIRNENFDGMGTTATESLPAGFKASTNISLASANPVGVYSSSSNVAATNQNGGTYTSPSISADGVYNFGQGSTNATATDRAAGFLVPNASPISNLMVELNVPAGTNGNVKVSYDIEKYRSGTRTFTMQLYYSVDGTSWTSAGGDFRNQIAGDVNNTTYYTTANQSRIAVDGKINLGPQAEGKLYLAFNYRGSSGSTGSQAIGFDNISVQGELTPTPEPTSALLFGSATACFALLRRRRLA